MPDKASIEQGHKKGLTDSRKLNPISMFLLESSKQPIRALLMYLHKKIIPMYKKFDEGHQTEHVLGVIKWSSRLVNALGNKFPVDINLMYAIAAFHDTGLKFGMNGHDKNVVKVIDQYRKDLLVWFTEKNIKDMVDACLFHDPKDGKKPKNIYGIILHDAGIIQEAKPEDVVKLMLPDSKKLMAEKLRFKK